MIYVRYIICGLCHVVVEWYEEAAVVCALCLQSPVVWATSNVKIEACFGAKGDLEWGIPNGKYCCGRIARSREDPGH